MVGGILVEINLEIVLVSFPALGFSACDDNESSSTVKKKLDFLKPEWDSRLSNVEPDTGKWFQLADEDEIAAYNIANIYSEKIKDEKKAIEWYLYSDSIKTINQNLVNMATSYKDIQDYKNSIKYYTQAYLSEDKKAADGLALLYEINLNDYKEAESWYKKTIERASLGAVKNLALLYHNNLNDDLKASAYYISLIDRKYSKDEVLNLLRNKWNLSNETIKKVMNYNLTHLTFLLNLKII